MQNGFHDLISSAHANGWDNQLQDEFGYQLLYEHRWRNIGKKRLGPVEMDFSPHVGFSLGNIATYANAGITLRLGRDLRNDFGVPRIRPSLPGSSFFQVGFAVIWRKLRLAYTYVIRSKEYEGQEQPDRFGSVGLTWRF